jgi:hypothetical protein
MRVVAATGPKEPTDGGRQTARLVGGQDVDRGKAPAAAATSQQFELVSRLAS